VKTAFDEIFARTGRVDVLVNNAGIAGKAAPITDRATRTGSSSSA